jgi:hypothetical protein
MRFTRPLIQNVQTHTLFANLVRRADSFFVIPTERELERQSMTTIPISTFGKKNQRKYASPFFFAIKGGIKHKNKNRNIKTRSIIQGSFE